MSLNSRQLMLDQICHNYYPSSVFNLIHITRHPGLQLLDFVDPSAFELSERMTNTKHFRSFFRITEPRENGRKQKPSVCWLLLRRKKSRTTTETPFSYPVKRPHGWRPAQRNMIPSSKLVLGTLSYCPQIALSSNPGELSKLNLPQRRGGRSTRLASWLRAFLKFQESITTRLKSSHQSSSTTHYGC
jgi:hypothetical protein